MAADHLEHGGGLLAKISNEIVRAQKQYFGKGPVQAKSYMLDDMLFVVLRGGITVAEETMLELGQPGLVREFRQAFETQMKDRFCRLVEELTGRRVLNYQSQIMFDPHVVVEIFIFDGPASDDGRAATAHGQLSDAAPGHATAGRVEP